MFFSQLEPQPTPAISPPDNEASRTDPADSRPRDRNDTLRMIAMVGVIICGFFQVLGLANGDVFFLATLGALLAWFFLAKQIVPLYLMFFGILLLRFGMIVTSSRTAFLDYGASDFLFHLFDSVTFVTMIALGFIYYELNPKRMANDGNWEPKTKTWHQLEPFSGLLIRLPIAVTCALVLYFMSGHIQSPIDSRILRPMYAQTYLVALFLFAVFLLIRSLADIFSWRQLKPDQARFYLRNQVGLELGEEMDLLRKPAWSRIDHASSVGGMFLVQWTLSLVLATILMVNARLAGNVFMWPAVAALFVFLTAFYNAIKTARSDVGAEQHIISTVAFIVVAVVGLQSLPVMNSNGWRFVYLAWWSFNALIMIRMGYLWMLDEYFARKYGWESAKPFSWFRSLLIIGEVIFAGFILYVLCREMLILIG